DTMTEQGETAKRAAAKCLQHNWVEERAVAGLDTAEDKRRIQRHGHTGILTLDLGAKMENTTTLKSAFVAPKSPGVRRRGTEERRAAMNPPAPKPEYRSTTQRDFSAQGFLPLPLQSTNGHDYKTEQAVTFWSENYRRIQVCRPLLFLFSSLFV
uniref:Sperm associated antigen 8 n=1 Tax=Salarias fasciatus TaxID=181472 RepID=A0A672JNU8_SALFA